MDEFQITQRWEKSVFFGDEVEAGEAAPPMPYTNRGCRMVMSVRASMSVWSPLAQKTMRSPLLQESPRVSPMMTATPLRPRWSIMSAAGWMAVCRLSSRISSCRVMFGL